MRDGRYLVEQRGFVRRHIGIKGSRVILSNGVCNFFVYSYEGCKKLDISSFFVKLSEISQCFFRVDQIFGDLENNIHFCAQAEKFFSNTLLVQKMPFEMRLKEKLSLGSSLAITGTPLLNAERFVVNFSTASEHFFHFRVDFLKGRIRVSICYSLKLFSYQTIFLSSTRISLKFVPSSNNLVPRSFGSLFQINTGLKLVFDSLPIE